MNWMYKLEQKWGRYAISDLHKYFVIVYFIGYAMDWIGNGMFYEYFAFSMPLILQGQIWRLITWVLCVNSNGFFGILFMLCLIPMGRTLERFIGTFRMNVYLIGGVILNIIGGIVVYIGSWIAYGVGFNIDLSLYYILLTTFMALALCIPDATVNLYFILPIKMKWMLIVYFVELVYEVYCYYAGGAQYSVEMGLLCMLMGGSQIILALLNLFLFFFFSKIHVSRKQKKRQREFQAQMRKPNYDANQPRHKCVICGRTEKDDPQLVFRFCSKCTGNKEYCQDHLFTHTHN